VRDVQILVIDFEIDVSIGHHVFCGRDLVILANGFHPLRIFLVFVQFLRSFPLGLIIQIVMGFVVVVTVFLQQFLFHVKDLFFFVGKEFVDGRHCGLWLLFVGIQSPQERSSVFFLGEMLIKDLFGNFHVLVVILQGGFA